MRSIGTLAVVTGLLLLGSSCDGGGGITPPENTAPVADFAMPDCIINVTCEFVSTSTDDAEVTEWSWDFNGDGTPDANTATAAYQYKAAGDFSVSLTVHDAQGLSHAKTSTITIAPVPPNNPPPTASFTHACEVTACTFVSTSSDVAPGTIASYEWNFGDGATADVDKPSHDYNVTVATDFTVTLTVTDNQGATAVVSQTVTVNPVPNASPTAAFTYACNLAVCTFASTSTDVAPGTIASYAWTFGDGGTAAVNNPSHTYSVTARTEFTVTLTVTDNEGATDVETTTIAVDPLPPVNPPPSARFVFSCAGVVCTFVNTSFDHGGKVTAQAWTFGDGGTATEATATHTYTVTTVTEFTVTLTVTDNEGATAIASQKFTLDPNATNIPPTARFTSWCYGDGCIFTSTSTDAAPGQIVKYLWSFGDGATAEWDNWMFPHHLETHVYTISGPTQITATLTVTDNEGATAVATQTVTLSPLPPAVQGCTTSGKIVECVLDIPTRSTLKVTVNGISCSLVQKISTPPPVGDQMFLSVCNRKVGDATGIFGGPLDELWVYQAGSQARIWFTQDATTTRPLNPPAGHVEGTYPDWTLSFEDGDHPGAAGEPDFTDIVIGVHATAR
jgi:PKD repeat protein